MLLCQNPNCPNPLNPDGNRFCISCGQSNFGFLLRNRFRVKGLLGKGGFGRTYAAEDTDRLDAPCVIKQFFPQVQGTAALPQVNRRLSSDPSGFKDANRPVDSVSWEECVEFCARLTQKTGYDYRLPSEAQWEYACRAGTTTPFHFGNTITSDLANYDGTFIYGYEPKGKHYEQTTPVGSFQVANSFGLYDMHGLVWEWCADPWHENYHGAPADGSVWEKDGNNNLLLLRGGCWNSYPKSCRSASRLRYQPYTKNRSFGFRVVALF